MTVEILVGDVLEQLKKLKAKSVQTIICSPPYWSLRNYDVEGQLGLEATPQLHVKAMVRVFMAARRVLKDDGILWVNYGDSYAGSWGAQGKHLSTTNGSRKQKNSISNHPKMARDTASMRQAGLKPKDLCGIPFRFAIEMQRRGWWWRQTLPWLKRNGMPESGTDRPLSSVEYVLMFTKSQKYFYAADAVMLPTSPATNLRVSQNVAAQIGSLKANGATRGDRPMKAVVKKQDGHGRRHEGFTQRYLDNTVQRPKSIEMGNGVRSNTNFEAALAGPLLEDRNFRNSDLFWMSIIPAFGLISNAEGMPLALDVPVKPSKIKHFATFPPKLVEPLLLASSREGDLVLDCFGGSGTTMAVADQHKRNGVMIEINADYAKDAGDRVFGPLFSQVGA